MRSETRAAAGLAPVAVNHDVNVGLARSFLGSLLGRRHLGGGESEVFIYNRGQRRHV